MTDTDVRCQMCGMVPAQALPIRRHVGIVLVQRFVKYDQPLCRTHGQQLTKSFLGKTLVQGWWGLISFFVNIFVVISDLIVLSRFGRLATPNIPNQGFAAPREVAGQWYPDPHGRHELRWFDGLRWTANVSDRGVPGVDPVA